MEVLGIKKHQTYIKYFNDLVDWGFIRIIKKSSNQFSSNIISLIHAMPKNGKALDKANINLMAKQAAKQIAGDGSIDIQYNNITNKQETISFDFFWQAYPRKEGKSKAKEKWDKLSKEVQETILKTLPDFLNGKEVKFVPMPVTYFNNKRWDDELPVKDEMKTAYVPTQNNDW